MLRSLGYDEIAFAKLGPDYEEAIALLFGKRGASGSTARATAGCPYMGSAGACVGATRVRTMARAFGLSTKERNNPMAAFNGMLSLQFVIHLANRYSVNQLVELAGLAHRRGFERIWVNDNARYRSQVVVLSAIAARVPIGIGTAILVPYLHHPIEVVDSLAALSELSEGREIGFGLARGDLAQTPQHVEVRKPIALVRQLAVFARRALAGERVPYGDFPVLCEYYHLNPVPAASSWPSSRGLPW